MVLLHQQQHVSAQRDPGPGPNPLRGSSCCQSNENTCKRINSLSLVNLTVLMYFPAVASGAIPLLMRCNPVAWIPSMHVNCCGIWCILAFDFSTLTRKLLPSDTISAFSGSAFSPNDEELADVFAT